MLERFRGTQARLLRPVAEALVRAGVSPDAVTWLGALGLSAVALVCFPAGWLWQGALLALVLSTGDMLDGHMARALPHRDPRWGAFLDSTLDRISDAALFGGLAWHLVLTGRGMWAAVAVAALVAAQVTSYVKARGEAVGCRVNSGIVTRADRVAIALLGAFLAGLGVPWALEAAMTLLFLGGWVTVAQRLTEVRRQLP